MFELNKEQNMSEATAEVPKKKSVQRAGETLLVNFLRKNNYTFPEEVIKTQLLDGKKIYEATVKNIQDLLKNGDKKELEQITKAFNKFTFKGKGKQKLDLAKGASAKLQSKTGAVLVSAVARHFGINKNADKMFPEVTFEVIYEKDRIILKKKA